MTATNMTTTPITRPRFSGHRMWVVARTELKQLAGAKDYWIPMALLGSLFFIVLPAILLLTVSSWGDTEVVTQVSQSLRVLPKSAQAQISRIDEGGQTLYALSVFLFAPVAVIVPITISTAVGAATIVGERERGTGEFLAHSPASAREIYLGKLIASFVPGYLTTLVGFGCYSVLVNTIAGPAVGGWFFPTAQWWVMVLWIIPPFLALTLSLVLRLSATVRSTAAAQQASGLISLPLIGIAYGQSSGAVFGQTNAGIWVGAIAWAFAVVSLTRGVRSVTRARLLGVANEA
ncbi:MAG: ABC transporter permease subunit [Microthrixaceae bacterium]|nr:ABC transporter permease subunit [Microthrixaceae bacterium]MCO5313713.1 ABC transporter permease subunit [Microthrixaceae bacterium]